VLEAAICLNNKSVNARSKSALLFSLCPSSLPSFLPPSLPSYMMSSSRQCKFTRTGHARLISLIPHPFQGGQP